MWWHWRECCRTIHSRQDAAAATRTSTETSLCRHLSVILSPSRCTGRHSRRRPARCTTWRRNALTSFSCGCSVLRRLLIAVPMYRQTSFNRHLALLRSTDTPTARHRPYRSDKTNSFRRWPTMSPAVSWCNVARDKWNQMSLFQTTRSVYNKVSP